MADPKEKAQELVKKYKVLLDKATPTLNRPIYNAKQCAFIAVYEVVKTLWAMGGRTYSYKKL